MQMPRQQGRWPARVLVALLLVISAIAISWRDRIGQYMKSVGVEAAQATTVRQAHGQELRIGEKELSQGEYALAIAEQDEADTEFALTGLGCDEVEEYPAAQAEPVEHVASRVDPLLELPAPEWNVPPEPPSLSDVQAEQQAAQRAIEAEALRAAVEPVSTTPQAAWPAATALHQQLAEMNGDPRTSAWCVEVESALARLAACPSLTDLAAAEALAALQAQHDLAAVQLAEMPYCESTSRGLRVNYSLERRLAVWEQAREIAMGEAAAPVLSGERLRRQVAAVRLFLADRGPVDGWSDYLLLEEIEVMPLRLDSAAEKRAFAARALQRIEAEDLSQHQLQMLAQPPIQALARELRAWASEPVAVTEVLECIERFEAEPGSQHAAELAFCAASCSASHRDDVAELGQLLETHWRNANMRISISGEFMNLFMPSIEPVREPVRDHILGASVRGQSASSTELAVVLYPDPSRVFLGLAARGDIESRTRSHRGPVTLYNDGYGYYTAEKIVTIDPSGVYVWGAESDAHCQSRLRGINSTFDGVPLMGNMVRNIARHEHDEQRGVVRWEFERRVERRAEDRFDEEVNGRLAQVDQQLEERVLDPLRELQLDPTAIDMHTTEERVIFRSRLAGEHQVSAHTPRPAPLDDSLLNVQIHQSAINNAVQQLGLDGRRCDLRELYAELATQLGDESGTIPEDLPEGVTLELAAEDAVNITCENGRVRIELNVSELSRGRKSWRGFTVRAYYEPQLDGLQATMARTSGIELAAEGLRIGDKLALRGIFTKVFSRSQTLQLVPDQLIERPAMAGVVVTQFRIEDGWVGMSLGYPNGERPLVAEAESEESR